MGALANQKSFKRSILIIMLKVKYINLIIWLLSILGLLTLCFLIFVLGLWITNSSEDSSGITAPLEKIYTPEKYFGQINNEPLIKSEIFNVVGVRVLSETPTSAQLEIRYDSNDNAKLEGIYVSAAILKDTGLRSMSYTRPAKVTPGKGKTSIVKLGISDRANFEILATNTILIKFYKGGDSPFHEAKYKYQRIWCRETSKTNDLWKRPYPKEKGSKYSINGARSVSRLCLTTE
jgi:hypothetical protein